MQARSMDEEDMDLQNMLEQELATSAAKDVEVCLAVTYLCRWLSSNLEA